MLSELKYAKNIVTDTKPYTQKEIEWQNEWRKNHPFQSTVKLMRLLWMDETMVKGASMYMECCWLSNGKTTSGTTEEPHMHEDFDEVIGFISTDKNNPGELDARMEIILGDETHFLTKSCLVYIPAGMKHCPLTFREVNRPVFFFTLAPRGMYGRRSETAKPEMKPAPRVNFVPPPPDSTGSRFARFIVTSKDSQIFPRLAETPKAETSRVVSLNDSITRGVMQAEFMWIWNGSISSSPCHRNFDEMIGIISAGSPENPRDIHGDISVNIEGEKHVISKSALVYLHKGLEYGLEFENIRQPVLCFTIGKTAKQDRQNPVRK